MPVLLWGLSACATYAPAPLSLFVPVSGSTSPSEQALSRVPMQPPAMDEAGTREALSIDQIVRACVLRDPRIAAALASVQIAQADYAAAAALPNPTVSLSQTLNPFPSHEFSPQAQGGPPQLDVGLSFSMDGILFGKRAAAIASARIAIDGAMAGYADVVRQRVRDAILAYYDVLRAQEGQKLAQDALLHVRRLEQVTGARVSLGSVGSIELDRVRLAVLAAQREALTADGELDKAMARLRARVGASPREPMLAVRGALHPIVPPAPPPPWSDVLASAEELRPDLLAARRQMEQAGAEVRVAQRDAAPQLSIQLGYTRQFQQGAIGFPDVSAWGAGLQMTLPIFNQNQGAIAKAKALRRQAEHSFAATHLDVEAELAQAYRDYVVAYELVTRIDAATLSAADSARRKIQEAYRLGGRTLLEVLDAQQTYREAMRATLDARAGYFRALHALNATVGKEVIR